MRWNLLFNVLSCESFSLITSAKVFAEVMPPAFAELDGDAAAAGGIPAIPDAIGGAAAAGIPPIAGAAEPAVGGCSGRGSLTIFALATAVKANGNR